MNNGIPNTFRALSQSDAGDSARPRVFESALKQFARAFRLGEPATASLGERLEWEKARAEVRNHLLGLVSQSPWQEHLVLRGSALLQNWFGESAREPRDIDWVFQPQTVRLGDPQCEQCYRELVELVRGNPRTPNAEILTSQIAADDIWTYERAAGRRIVFPFRSREGVKREIQMDIVWGEPLFEPPIQITLQSSDTHEISLWAATPELSLAWKLLWLITDMFPQGKDLYDAVLLAESTYLPLELLYRVLEPAFEVETFYRRYISSLDTLVAGLKVDWDNFKMEYPGIEGEEKEWVARLVKALEPTFGHPL